MTIDMREQARASVAIESIPDDAIEAAQEAFHEFAFGPGEPLSKRDKGITRLAYRAEIHAALEAMSEGYEYAEAVDYGDGVIEVTKHFGDDPNRAVDEGHFLVRRPTVKWEKIGEVVRYGD